MNEPLQFLTVTCPWCGEQFDTEIDLSAGDQQYTEDCQICCAPISLNIQVDQLTQTPSCSAERDF
jgi:transcription elongation factor Elf1